MINKKYTPISEGKARKIAAQWCESSDRKKIILDGIITSAQQELQYKSSSAKSIKKISKLLADFFSAEEIYKKFFQNTPRKISFEIILAYLIQEEIEFRVMRGEINGRSGGCHLSENTAAKISWHAFTRVLNRNEFENKIESFKEILDSLQIADAWNSAGYSCHAQCWPILSLNGFFVAVPSKVKDVAIFVTWMKSDNLSKKWGVVLDNLKALRLNNPILIKDSIFARKFIGSFPWMLREHLPGVDIHKIAWDSLNIENIDSKSAASVEEGIEFDAEDLYINIDGIKSTKTSDTYIPGLNYQNSRPPFANHSRHCGVVVQKRASGALIISLKDSLYGKIPQISNDRSEELIPGSVNSNIGDELEVEVKKIFFIADESAYLISLDRASLMDKIWNDAKKKYPIHAEISGVIIAQYTNECIVALTDGVRGKVPIETIRWKLANK